METLGVMIWDCKLFFFFLTEAENGYKYMYLWQFYADLFVPSLQMFGYNIIWHHNKTCQFPKENFVMLKMYQPIQEPVEKWFKIVADLFSDL